MERCQHHLTTICLFILCLLWACSSENKAQSSPSLIKSQIDSLGVQVLNLPNQTQVSIGFIKDGEVSFLGLKHENGQFQRIINHKNTFEIGSITKLFTATLLAQLVTENKIQLTDPIDEYLGISPPIESNISFVELANHTSGLPRIPINIEHGRVIENPYQHYNEQRLVEYIKEDLVNSIHGKGQFLYSNLGLGLLGYLACKMEGQSYEALLQSKIFSKYGMTRSTSKLANVQEGLINGLNERGDQVPNWELSALEGAGAVLSTTEDLSKFALAHFETSDPILALTRKSNFRVDHISERGLGWEIINRKSGATWYKHSGRTGGYTSAMIINVKEKNGLIILSNVSGLGNQNNIIEDWSFDLMKQLENK